MKKTAGMKIATKFALVIAIVLALCSASIGTLAYVTASTGAQEALEDRLQAKVADSAALIQQKIGEYFVSLEGVAVRPDIMGMDWDVQLPVITEEAKRLGFMKMGISDLNGKAAYSNGTSTDISKRQYFQSAKSGKTNISDPLMSTAEHKMVMVIATPIKDAGGAVVGVLLATSDDRFLSNLVSGVKEGETGYAFMLSKAGVTIAHPDQELVNTATNNSVKMEEEKDKDLESLVTVEKKMTAGGNGFDTFTRKGVPYFISYTGMGELGWSMAIAVTQEEVLEPTVQMRNRIMLVTLVCLLAGLLVAILFAQILVSKPIQGITAAARKLALGDIDVSIKSRSKDEIGLLSAAFGNIINGIRQQSEAAGKIAEGDMDADVSVRSDKDVLNISLESMIRTQRLLSGQFNSLIQASSDGDFSVRGDVGQFSGQYAVMLSGVNSILAEAENAVAGIRKTQAHAEKQAEYQKAEVDKLVHNLERLANGVLHCDMQAAPPDEDTEELYAVYDGISRNLHASVDAIRGYITDITDTLGMMSEGSFDVQITGEYRGDFVRIKDSINAIIVSLSSVLADINTSAEQVASGTHQVSAGAQALSQGATEQASAIEQLTSSLAEIAGQTRQNAIDAGRASELASAARDNAEAGNTQMNELQAAMNDINESSAGIGKIIKVIDEIAFQTNLLALNAAVEAARAGQHGKGFAVVAEEVRSLAQRSANAAKETSAMIEGSIRKAKAGTKIANDTAVSLGRIVDDVEKATELVGGIARASSDQATAVAQVNKGVEQVSQVTQTNSATAEESAAASEELSGQAAMLKDMVGRFSLGGKSSPGRQASIQLGREARVQPEGRRPGKPRIALGDREFGKY